MEIPMALQDRLDAFKAAYAPVFHKSIIQHRRAFAERFRAPKTKELCHG
jgi:hypothetical protein